MPEKCTVCVHAAGVTTARHNPDLPRAQRLDRPRIARLAPAACPIDPTAETSLSPEAIGRPTTGIGMHGDPGKTDSLSCFSGKTCHFCQAMAVSPGLSGLPTGPFLPASPAYMPGVALPSSGSAQSMGPHFPVQGAHADFQRHCQLRTAALVVVQKITQIIALQCPETGYRAGRIHPR
jgi:hypothetical protein